MARMAKGSEKNRDNPRVKSSGKEHTRNTLHNRNKNNLTDLEQAFADLVLRNPEGLSATDLILQVIPGMKRSSARVKASNWMADNRIRAYMDKMRERVEQKVEYDLVKWRADVLELIEIAMGRKEREQHIAITNEEGQRVFVQLPSTKQFEGAVAKGALELIAKQMKLLTEKSEVDVGEKLREIFGTMKPTLGPPSLREARDEPDDE